MNSFFKLIFLFLLALPAYAQQADIEVNTPAIAALKAAMQARHNALAPLYTSGAVGLTKDGLVAMREASGVPLAQRTAAASAIADENKDRAALYKEIASANKHPEWEAEVRSTFASRWISKAQSGWYYQNASGEWTKK
ncbi:MAG: YdbL family protein [Burkholderiales bacterium]